MTPSSWIAGGVSLTLALLLVALWRRRGWGDASVGAEGARKLQRSAVPAVGGLAIAGGWGLLAALDPALVGGPGSARVLGGLALALAAGALDDARPGGLRPRAKLLLQFAAALLVATWNASEPAAEPTAFGHVLELLLRGVLVVALVGAQNALNTFDNADGAATGTAATGLLVAGSPLAPAVLLFLVPNLLLRRRVPGEGGAPLRWRDRDPLAYLGDGGSQLLGLALLLVPGARLALLIPALDLARVAVDRLRAGQAIWVGDRRHLAHRLQRAGLGPMAVVGLLVGLGLPALVRPTELGALASTALYLVVVVLTRPFAAEDAVRSE